MTTAQNAIASRFLDACTCTSWPQMIKVNQCYVQRQSALIPAAGTMLIAQPVRIAQNTITSLPDACTLTSLL